MKNILYSEDPEGKIVTSPLKRCDLLLCALESIGKGCSILDELKQKYVVGSIIVEK